jgi:hypothetical protein
MRLFMGIIFVLLGIGGYVWVDRREFYKKTAVFGGYAKAVVAKLFGKIVRIVSVLFVIWGIVCVLISLLLG